jgi:hypothetical protein
MINRFLRVGFAAIALSASAALAADSYRVTAAFDTVFDADGRIVVLQPHEEADYPAAFWDGLRQRVQGLRITAPLDASGRPAMLSTGLYVQVEVSAGRDGGQLKIVGMDVQPLVMKRGYVGYPEDIAGAAGWTGSVDAECLLGTDGRCGEVRVKALPGMPPSVLRWAQVTLALWEFKPPRINDVPFAVPVKQAFGLQTKDDVPVNFLQRGSGNAPFRW